MIKQLIGSIALLILLWGLSGCEQVIEIELPDPDPALVVYADFREGDDTLKVFVSHNISILDSLTLLDSTWRSLGDTAWVQPNPDNQFDNAYWVQNATVELYKDGVLYAQFTPYFDQNIYIFPLNVPFEPGNEIYELRVSAPDFPDVKATASRPTPLTTTDVRYTPLGGADLDGYPMDLVEIDLKDVSSGVDHAEFIMHKQDMYVWGMDTSIHAYTPYLTTNDFSLARTWDGIAVSDTTFTGDTYTVRVLFYPPYDEEFAFNEAWLQKDNISRDRYLFFKSFNTHINSRDNPFAEPSPLYTNIDKGRGLFSISSSETYTIY